MKRLWEVFWQFLLLGLISFGGPAAHIGYFQTTFVQKLKWIDAQAYTRLISLSQFLPGPGSSQIGFAIGHRRAGVFGGVAAFIGFTFPSVLLIFLLATINTSPETGYLVNGVVHGLKLLAVVVVADATFTMFKHFCKERLTVFIALISAIFLLLLPSVLSQMTVLVIAAFIGIYFGKPTVTISPIIDNNDDERTTRKTFSLAPFLLFIILLVGFPLIFTGSLWTDMFSTFYQSGSFVFGGGHVVLPLLQESIGEAISTDRFLLGYAAAQAVPGPMFSFAAFLGAELAPQNQLFGALIATVAIFLPGFLLLLCIQGSWEALARKPKVAGATWGINAAVVGLLFSALYQPLFVSAVISPIDMAWVLIGYFSLRVIKIPIVVLVLGFMFVGGGSVFV